MSIKSQLAAEERQALEQAVRVANHDHSSYVQLGEDLIHPVFHESALAKRSLSFQLFRAGINTAAWAARNEQAEAYFGARGADAAAAVAPSAAGWMTKVIDEANTSAPKYDRDNRDGAVVALALIALALDYEFVPSSPTYMQEAIVKACDRLASGLTSQTDASALQALLASTDDPSIQNTIASTFVSYKTDWLDATELQKSVISIIDCTQEELRKVSPGDILVPKDVIRPQLWALGDPTATTNQYGAFYDAIKAKEAGQVKLILEGYEQLSELESQLFPINEEN
jgi:hypothetical protein